MLHHSHTYIYTYIKTYTSPSPSTSANPNPHRNSHSHSHSHSKPHPHLHPATPTGTEAVQPASAGEAGATSESKTTGNNSTDGGLVGLVVGRLLGRSVGCYTHTHKFSDAQTQSQIHVDTHTHTHSSPLSHRHTAYAHTDAGPAVGRALRACADQRAIKVMTKIKNSPAATPMITCWTGRGP